MKKERAKKFFNEFKTFVSRGNALELAVGVIIGGAFTGIVSALTGGILQPIINWLLAWLTGTDGALSSAYTILRPAYIIDDTGERTLNLAQSIYIDWGAFIGAIVNFLLIAFVLFLIVKTVNALSESADYAGKLIEKRKVALKRYKKEGLTKREALARYEKETEELKKKEAEEEKRRKEEEERLLKEKEEKNTRLLEEIRDLLKSGRGN